MEMGVDAYLLQLSSDFPNARILVSGMQLANADDMPPRVQRFSNTDELKAHLLH